MENENRFLIERLIKPDHPVDVILDTDAFNEIDDQYALAYLLRSTEKLRVQALYAVPFFIPGKVENPAEGMEKSYNEIFNILSLTGADEMGKMVFRGSEDYLSGQTPAPSDAARDLVERAMARADGDPLYVVAIGCITNIASALLMCPEIAKKIVLVWLSGHSYHWFDTMEFNMMQDLTASRVVFDSKVPLVQLPCMGVVSHLSTTEPELRHHLKGKNKLGDYLYNITCKEVSGAGDCWSRVIWDVSAVAWLVDENFTSDMLVHAPIPTYDYRYSFDQRRHLMKAVYSVDRDRIFADMFAKLSAQSF